LCSAFDPDSQVCAELFDEADPAVLDTIARILLLVRKPASAHRCPSDRPEYAEKLVKLGITSISVNPDVAYHVRDIIAGAERRMLLPRRGGRRLRRFLRDIGCTSCMVDPEQLSSSTGVTMRTTHTVSGLAWF
jgi:hypothetical protein